MLIDMIFWSSSVASAPIPPELWLLNSYESMLVYWCIDSYLNSFHLNILKLAKFARRFRIMVLNC